MIDYQSASAAIKKAQRIVIIQPENPDGDSLGSAIALEHILGDLGKQIDLFCAVDMPKYLRYIKGWDRVDKDWTGQYDLAIIVDTASDTLLEYSLEVPGLRHFLSTKPVLVLDHHTNLNGSTDLSFDHQLLLGEEAAATSELIYDMAQSQSWTIPLEAAESMFISIQSDTLGLTTESVTPHTFLVAAKLVELGAMPATIENRRRQFMKKPADILTYKGELISRISYHCDGQLATVHIPWEDIEAYSDRYNPSVLVLDEMRLVEGVQIAVAIKTYPDGKLTGKIRSNLPIALDVAGYFGGGGHDYAAGFKVYESLQTIEKELVQAVIKALESDR